ncbi:hypothetical protein ACEPPN_019476 [Leptodophora sp. 'Broadleaf-Isolate-01']
MRSPQGRALVFFLTTPYFNHFLEQCVTSYPSALDENALFFAKVILLFVAGVYEYFIYAGIIGSIAFSVQTIRYYYTLFVRQELLIDYQTAAYENAMLVLFMFFSFAVRAKSFANTVRRRTPRIDDGEAPNIWTMLSLLLWYNPAVFCYAVLGFIAYHFRERTVSPSDLVSLFWEVLSPASQIFSYFQNFVYPAITFFSFRNLWHSVYRGVKLQLRITTTQNLVREIPRTSIGITIIAQSFTYWMSQNVNTNTNQQQMEAANMWREAFQFNVQMLRLASHMINNFFSIMWTIGRELYIHAIQLHQKAFIQEAIQEEDVKSATLPYGSAPTDVSPTRLIKLLRIRPGFHNDPVQCDRFYHNVDNPSCHPYTAISYTWKDHTLKHSLTIYDGAKATIKVTSSAFEVLKNLRSHLRPVTIWIDAICIDQSSDEDKAQQLPLMPEIYQGASQTIIWLGHSSKAALAIAAVNRIFILNRLERLLGPNIGYQLSPSAAEALQEMFQCQWYGRAWIVQEVVRSKHSIIIRYGEESLLWEKFTWFCQAILRDEAWLKMISDRASQGGLSLTALRNVQVIKRFSLLISQEPKQPISILFYLAQMFRSSTRFDASETKDRIHALLGLSGSTGDTAFKPDYKATVRQLYIQVVEYLGKNNTVAGRPLDFLIYAGIGYGPLNPDLGKKKSENDEIPEPPLPSWVPNWSLETKTIPLIGTDGTEELLQSNCMDKVLQDAAKLASFGQTKPAYIAPSAPTNEEEAFELAVKAKNQMQETFYKAASGLTPDYSFHDEILTLRGNEVDRIHWVGQEFPESSTAEAEILSILGECARKVQDVCAPIYPDTTTFPRAFAFLNALGSGFSKPELDLTFITVAQRHKSSPEPLDISVSEYLFNLLCNVPIIGGGRNQEIPLALRDYIPTWKASWAGRVFGITKRGRMGLFLAGTTNGDVVSVFHGVQAPFSLKTEMDTETGATETGYFTLVGPAYVHGIMDGSVFTQDCEVSRMFELK